MLLGELVRELVLDPKLVITENDMVDLQHAMISIRCCDFVLLDRKWEQRVNTLRRRIEKKQEPQIRIAQCFSKRGNGVEKFLQQLEAF